MTVSPPGSPGGTQSDFGKMPSANGSMMILLPTHNRSGVLSQTLDAFLETDRTGIDLEIVVVDNNCTDDTTECVAKFRNKLPLILLKEPRPGKNCALNKALRERPLRDLVVFVDDDITPKADWLQQIVAASRRWPNASVFGSRVTVDWPHGKQPDWVVADWVKVLGFAWHDLGDEEKAYPANTTPMGPCLWVRKEVFSKVSSLDETIGPRPTNRIMGSEVSFLLRLERHGFKMAYCPAVGVEHRIQPEECCLRALKRRAYRSGRGEVRLYGIHRAPMFNKSRQLWNLTMFVDLCFHAGSGFLGSFLVPNKRKRAELILNAAMRVGRITESWRIVHGRVS